jgi:PhnB protein
MSDKPKLPHGYHSIQPYLMFIDSAKAIAFFIEAFGAKERMRMQEEGGGRINHAELQFGDSVVMLADENPAIHAYGPKHYGGSPISLMIYVEDCDTTYHRALAAGATSEREPADQPYGDRMAGILDPFGYKWWIGHPLAKEAEAKP